MPLVVQVLVHRDDVEKFREVMKDGGVSLYESRCIKDSMGNPEYYLEPDHEVFFALSTAAEKGCRFQGSSEAYDCIPPEMFCAVGGKYYEMFYITGDCGQPAVLFDTNTGEVNPESLKNAKRYAKASNRVNREMMKPNKKGSKA